MARNEKDSVKNSRSKPTQRQSVEDTMSYHEIPYSEETPEDRFHSFMSLEQVIAKVNKDQKHGYECRTVGIVSQNCGSFAIQELNDTRISVRLSLKFLKHEMPFAGRPFAAQLFGYVLWHAGCGPVIYVKLLLTMPVDLAQHLRTCLIWASETLCVQYPEEIRRTRNRSKINMKGCADRRARRELSAEAGGASEDNNGVLKAMPANQYYEEGPLDLSRSAPPTVAPAETYPWSFLLPLLPVLPSGSVR